MSTSRYERAKQIFLDAVARPEAERAGFVAEASTDDPTLRAEVESLLGWHATEPDKVARFTAGDLFAGRYRIVSWLGEGGAGEVWRAHDTVLDEPVALKLIRRPGERARQLLLNEARLARRVTHPSVCRVFDVGEAGGDVFLSMEFVDGEDLGRLLRRVGRLPVEKVIEIAAHLCGALAAAHAQGVLHRDLKPANILIDANGHVRITDFGIATAASEAADGFLAGTPGYMAPEQMIPNGQVSERTDLYALGLVFYELVTGMRPLPSSGLTGAPPQLEPLIRQATAPDPRDRPASALALASLLPGVNAAALAIEAGVTPSPALVAASPDVAGPSARTRIVALVTIVALSGAVLALADPSMEVGRAAFTRSPDVLVDRAAEMLKSFGHTVDTALAQYGYIEDPLARDPEHALLFWISVPTAVYQSRFVDRVLRMSGWLDPKARVPLVEPGEIVLLLDRDARLVFLQAPTVTAVAAAGTGTTASWRPLLAAAGFDEDSLTPAAAPVPPGFATTRAAWTAPDRSSDETSRLHIEAALTGQLPVYFSAVREGAEADERLAVRRERPAMFDAADTGVLLLIVIAGALAIRNARRGSAGWVDARRITFFICGSAALGEVLLTADYPRHPLDGAVSSFSGRLLIAQTNVLLAWVLYLGLEPVVRRCSPEALVSWTRLIAGRVRDVQVGWSLLVGVVGGLTMTLLFQADIMLAASVGGSPEFLPVALDPLNNALGVRPMVGHVLRQVVEAIYDGLLTMLVFGVIKATLGAGWRGLVLFVLVRAVFATLGGATLAVSWITLGLAWSIVAALVISRAGMLGYVASVFVYLLLRGAPLTASMQSWYAERGMMALLLVVALGVAGFILTSSTEVARRLLPSRTWRTEL